MWSAYTCIWAQVLILLRILSWLVIGGGEGSGHETTVMNNGRKQEERIMLDNRLPEVGVVLG